MEYRSCDISYCLRKTAFRLVGVHTDAKHSVVKSAAFHAERSLREYSAYLPAVYVNVVNPFYVRLLIADLFHSKGNRYCSSSGYLNSVSCSHVRAEKNAHVKSRIRGREERTSKPSTPLGLHTCNDYPALGYTLICIVFEYQISGAYFLVYLYFKSLTVRVKIFFYACKGKYIGVFIKGIALVRHRRDRVAVFLQSFHSFPNSPSGAAQRVSKLFA